VGILIGPRVSLATTLTHLCARFASPVWASNRAEAREIGEFWSYPKSRTFAELLIDCEEDRTLRGGARRVLWEADKVRLG
jgi:hypothetical protein